PVLPLPLLIPEAPEKTSRASPLTVAYLGHASHHKGFHLLPDVIAQFTAGDAPHFVVQFYGNEGLFRQQAERLAKLPRVTFLSGPLGRGDYARLMNEADIILLPYSSAFYGWASSGILAEALSLGKVVVVPDQTWLSRQMKDFKSGGVAFSVQS